MRQAQLVALLALGLDLALALPGQGWGLRRFKSLVTFGDSYTDDSRLNYFGSHDGAAPPVGWEQPVVRTMTHCAPRQESTTEQDTEQQLGFGRLQLGLLRCAIGTCEPIQLRRERCRVLKQNHTADILHHQRTIPIRVGIRSPSLPGRQQVHDPIWKEIPRHPLAGNSLLYLDRDQRSGRKCVLD